LRRHWLGWIVVLILVPALAAVAAPVKYTQAWANDIEARLAALEAAATTTTTSTTTSTTTTTTTTTTVPTTTTTTAPTTTTTQPTTTTTAPPPAMKPFATGLVTTDPPSINLYPYANAVTIKSVGWETVEPSPGVYDWSAIDNVIAATVAEAPDVKFRIRLYAGRQSPAWLNQVSGQCVEIVSGSPNGGNGCVPRFWTDAFQDRYDLLMDAFAAKYENDPRIVDVVNSACTTIFAEPFILGGDGPSLDLLWQAGLTEAGHRDCLNRSMSKMMDVFPTTRVTMAGHSNWQIIVQGPNGPGDATAANSWPKERDILNQWRAAYGDHMVVEEHSLNDTPAKYCAPGEPLATASVFYCWYASSPAPKGLQFTATFTSMEAAARQGESMGSCFLEFAAFQAIPMPARQDIHNLLVENCPQG
jgi:hypothetical protein